MGVTEHEDEFEYDRSIMPNLGVLLTLALIETVVVHLLAVALWGWTVAIVLGVIDVSAVIALLGLLRAIKRQPVTIRNRILTMRVGTLKVLPIPVGHVAGLREHWDGAALKKRDVLNLALATWPNVMIELDPPVAYRRRKIRAVAHKLDDASAFAKAIKAIMAEEAGTLPTRS